MEKEEQREAGAGRVEQCSVAPRESVLCLVTGSWSVTFHKAGVGKR